MYTIVYHACLEFGLLNSVLQIWVLELIKAAILEGRESISKCCHIVYKQMKMMFDLV